MNEELKGILEKAYANGKTIDEVSAALKKNGYGDEDISFAGNFYNSKKKKPTSGESQSTQVQEPSFLESSIRQAQPEKAQGPSFLELPKYESAVSKATKPIISPQQMERDFEQARMQSMETGKPIDMFSSPTGQIVAEGIKQENAQVKREELSLSIADKLSAIKSSDDLAKLRPEIDEAYAKYKEFDLDGVAPTSLFNDDGSFNSSTASFLDSDLKSSIKRFSDEQKRLAENSNFLTRGLDAVSSGVLGFIDLSARLPYYLVGADAEPMLGGNVFATESKKLSEKTSLANYAEKFNMGYTPEQIEKGSLSMAIDGDFGLLGIDMADQVVNLVGAAAGGGAGLAAMGVVSAGSAFTEVVDDNNYKDGEKVLYAVGSGLVEYLTEKLFASDLKALRRTFGTAEDIAKISRKDFGDMLFGKLPALARQPLEEGLEEAIVATTQEVMQLAMAGDKIDYKNIAESAFVGAAMGGSVGVVTSGPSALLQTRVFRDKIEIRNKIAEINELINDENISVEEKDLLKTRLTDYISKEKKMQADAEAYYSNFSEEDAAKTVKLNQTISGGMKNYSKLSSTEAKAQVASDIKAAMADKAKIEQKYDSQAQQQVPSPVIGGQAPQQAQPVEGAGTQETQAGGVLQTPQEVTATVERDLGPKVRSVKINAETVGKSVDFLTEYVNTKAEDFFALTGTTKEAAINGIESIKNVVDSFSKSNKNVRLVAHNNAESFKAATGEDNISRGMHIQRDVDANEIHIFVPAVAANTVYHEALHEVTPEILGVSGTKKLATALRNAITQDKALTQYMGDFISKYSGASSAELDDEFTTELASLIASNQIEVSVKRSLATKFLEVLNKALGTRFTVAPTSAQLIDAMNSIANSLGAGEAIDVEDMDMGSTVARGVYNGGSTKRRQSFAPANISFEDVNLPKNVDVITNPDKMTMDDALERSGGAFIIINSDGTALKQTEGGLDVYGGFGYSFIKQNIEDKIGFAASSDNKVTEVGELLKRVANERDLANAEHIGKPVAMFVMIQTPGAAFGNSYGAKFLADSISEAIKSGVISQEEFKVSFNEFVKKEEDRINNLTSKAEGTDGYEKTKRINDSQVSKIKLIGETVTKNDFNTKEGHDALQNLVASSDKIDFKTRREFLEKFFPVIQRARGLGKVARNAMFDAGKTAVAFFNEYVDKNIVDNLQPQPIEKKGKYDDGGYAISGFFVNDPYIGSDEYSRLGKAGSFKHPQFNSKFHGEDPFLLDGKYYVNKIFEPQQFVSKGGGATKVSVSVAGSMYVSSAKSRTSNRTDAEQAEAIATIRENAREALKKRYQKVDKSDLNSFYAYNAVLRSLQSEPKKNMRFLLESDISETGKSDVSSSRYLKFKAGDADKEIARSFEIRFADHTKVKGSEDAKMFVDEGHKIDRVNKIDYLNAWSPKTFVKVVDILRSFGFTITNKSVEGGLKRFQAGGSEYEYLRSVSDYVNGRLVPNISEQEFVDKMNQLGVSDYSAREVYNDFLDGGMGGKKKAKPNIDNIYKQYEDRVYQQPWYKALFNVRNLYNSLFDRQSNIKREILKSNVEGAYDYLISKAGASARAKYSVNKSDRKIFGGLNEESIKLLNKIISLRRIVEIDQSFDDRRAAATENLIKAKSDMDYAQYRVDSMASNLSVDKKNELKKKLDSATEEFNRIQKVVEESKRPLHTVDKKNNVSLDKESSLEELDRLSKESDNFEELDNRADAYFDEFRSILEDIYKNGLITDELYDKIKDFDYSPRVFLNHAFDFGDNDISVRDYGLSGDQIKAIRDGSADDTIMDARYLLSAYAASASSRILKNRANKALYKAALDSDNSDWVRTQSKTGEAERGFETVYFFEKGESIKFQLRTDLKREWDGANRLLEFGPKTTKAISYITGSALLKLLATRANPLFIVRNFPRDYGHILFFTNIYDNQNIYFAGYNLLKDFIKGVKSFKSDDKYFKEYMEMGGGMDFLSTDGRPGSLMQNKKFFARMVDKASSLGETSEVGFRIAVYKRLRDDATDEYNKKYGEDPTGDALELIKVNAVSRARAIIDFSQGGNLTKGLEIFKPYINSAFQGFRVGTEYIGRNPKKFASKFLQAQAGLLAISALNALVGGDDMDEIPDEVKLRYLIIMLPTKYTDEKGRERRAYIKIAKPQQMVPFFAMMDIMNGYVLGSILGKKYYPSDDLLGYAMRSVASAMPTGASLSEITSSVPTISMAMTYLTNYDLFRKRAVTMDFNEVLPMDEGINDPNVERFYKVIGKVTGDIEELTTGNKGGVSPARLKASAEKVITSPSSSLVVGATYGILDILTSVIPLDNDMSAAESKNAVGKVVDALGKNGISITKSTWGETNPDWKVYNQKEDLMKIDQESGSKRMKLSDSAKELGLEYISAKTEEEKEAVLEKAKEKVNEIKEDNAVDAMYYKDSFMTAAKKRSASQNTNEIIYSKDEEARAKKVYLLYGDMTDQELLDVRSQIYNESGYKLGPKFKYEYDKLTK
jgi:hypothetical protein